MVYVAEERKQRRKWLFSVGVPALIIPLVFTPAAALADSPYPPTSAQDAIASGDYLPSYIEEFIQHVDDAAVFEHVRHLAVDIGARVAGTPGEEAGLQYVEDTLESYGFVTEWEEFELSPQRYAMVTPSRDLEGVVSWQYRTANNIPLTGDVGVTAEVVDVGDGSDLPAEGAEGKFVLVNWIQNAGARNALLSDIGALNPAGVIFTHTAENSSIPNPGNVPGEVNDIIVVAAATVQGDRIRALLASEGDPLQLTIATHLTKSTSNNVIGTLPAKGKNPEGAPIIYIGAHIDSVIGSMGASDNATGVGVMLETARIISEYDLNVEVRAGAWGAEERGIIGSRVHAQSLTEEEIARSIGAWNMDMVGTSAEFSGEHPIKFWALTLDGQENVVTNESSVMAGAAGHETFQHGQLGRSDHQSFHNVGIPAALFIWLHWTPPTNVFLEPYYHLPTDTIDHISQERLGIATHIVGGGAFKAALNPVSVAVVDETESVAPGVIVAMSCAGDEGWRSVGVTDGDGVVSTLAPFTNCDFAAVGEGQAMGYSGGESVEGETSVSLQLVTDTIAPNVWVDVDPALVDNVWHNTAPVSVTISAVDEVDADPLIEYSLDGGATWLEYSGTFEVTNDGTHTVLARATDGAGNSAEVSEDIWVDTTPPELSATASAAKRGEFTVSSSDALSGLATVEYRVGAEEDWRPLDLSTLTDGVLNAVIDVGDGEVRAEFLAKDNAGNVSDVAVVDLAAVPPASGSGTLPTTGGIPVSVPLMAGIALILMVGGGVALSSARRRSAAEGQELVS